MRYNVRRMRRPSFVATVWTGVALVACGAAAAPPAPQFPPYTAQEARLFDDAIDPRVLGVGYDVPLVSPRSDTSLFERAQIGDGVVRARIDSVTIQGLQEATPIYELGVRVLEPLGRADGLPSEFTLRIGPDSPSFSLARALEGRLSGHTAIVFVRTYSTEAGEAVYHFHVVPDDPAVAAAVREATSLDRVALTGDGGAPPKK